MVFSVRLLVLFLFYIVTNGYAYSQGYFSIDKKSGLPFASDGGEAIIQTNYVYFGFEPSGKWTWAGQRNQFEIISDFSYRLSGDNSTFGYTYTGSISKIDEHSFSYEMSFDNKKAIEKVIGGGIEFRLNAKYNEEYGTPRLLENNTGWIWGDENSEHFKLEFANPVANVFFERRNPNIIRVYFFKDSIEVSRHHHQAIFSIPDDFILRQTDDELFGLYDANEWFEIEAPYYSPIDLSYLNHFPAGKHGFLQTDGDSLIFADGTSAKFWGTAISAHALFLTRYEDVENHARRIAALGFNLVRLTHFDASWVRPNVFGENSFTTNKISEDHMRILDKWVAKLNKNGVYNWFDFNHERSLKENDNIYGFEEIDRKSPNAKGSADLKGYSYFNDTIRLTMQSLNGDNASDQYSVISAAASSWGPENMLEYLKERGIYQSDLVFLVLSTHDIFNFPTFDDAVIPYRVHKNVAATDDLIYAIYNRIRPWLKSKISSSDTRMIVDEARDKAKSIINDIIELVQNQNKKIILVFHPTERESQNDFLDVGFFLSVANENNIEFINLQKKYKNYNNFNSDKVHYDGMHLTPGGANLVAEVFKEKSMATFELNMMQSKN